MHCFRSVLYLGLPPENRSIRQNGQVNPEISHEKLRRERARSIRGLSHRFNCLLFVFLRSIIKSYCLF